jgi:NifB/MoaA-like Fe-S oxidoreductase
VILRKIARLDDKFLTIADYHMHTDELKLNLDEKFDTKLSITDFNENVGQIETELGEKLEPISEELDS